MWVKKSREQVFPQQPQKATEEDLELFLMPWMAANPSNPHPPLVITRPFTGPGFLWRRDRGLFQGIPAAYSGRT